MRLEAAELNNMNPVIFWGAAGQARVVDDALNSSDYKLVAVFDNRRIQSPFPDVPLFVGPDGFLAWRAEQPSGQAIYSCVTIGGGRGVERLELQGWLRRNGIEPLTVLHPRSFVAETAIIGIGSQVLCMAAVCANARLGEAVIINTAATVDHECVLGDGVHVAPGAHLAGEVWVDDHAFIGMGALILPRVRIGQGAIIGAGSVVTRDVPAGETVIGSPAKPIKRDIAKDS